jgi:Rho termination factor, N-terminal domain
MAAPSRQQPRRIVDTIRATLGRGRATLRRLRPATRLRERSVADIRHLVGQSVTTTRGLPARAGRQLTRLTRRGRDLAGGIRTIPSVRERERGAAERATPTQRRQVEPAKARGRTQRREPQPKRRQAKRRQELEQQTVQQLRERARQAGIKGRFSMTKDQLIRALQPPSASGQSQTGPYEERTVEELQNRAKELGIEGRSSMTKDQLIKALRDHR